MLMMMIIDFAPLYNHFYHNYSTNLGERMQNGGFPPSRLHIQAYTTMVSPLALNFHLFPLMSVPVFTGSNLSHRCSTYNVSFFNKIKIKIVSRIEHLGTVAVIEK